MAAVRYGPVCTSLQPLWVYKIDIKYTDETSHYGFRHEPMIALTNSSDPANRRPTDQPTNNDHRKKTTKEATTKKTNEFQQINNVFQ